MRDNNMNISRRNQVPGSQDETWSRANLVVVLLTMLMLMWPLLTMAVVDNELDQSRSLDGIDVLALPGNKVQIKLRTSGAGTLASPKTFTTGKPARIALDLPETTSTVAKRKKVGIGVATSINAIESKGRTRIVMNLTQLVPYDIRVDGGDIYIILDSDASVSVTEEETVKFAQPVKQEKIIGAAEETAFSIRKIDFRRDDKGAGRVLISLSDPSLPIDIREERGRVVVNFIDTRLPSEMEQRLDVMDFATPVKQIDTFQRGRNVQMIVAADGRYEQLTYQADNLLTIEVRPVVKEEQEQQRKRETGYVGDKLTLNFQDIEVRAVLQLIADFTGLNMVTSDTVKGNVTLRLKNVPWDQALDLILQTKGLDMRKSGNVVMVAPSQEIAAREKQDYESQKQISELAPLFTDHLQINYAKADDIAALLKMEGNSLLSERGSTATDERTNTLLVQDTADKLEEIKQLVAKLDVPIRQVLIESRVVIANDDFSKELGARFGITEWSNYDLNPGSNNFLNDGGQSMVTGTLNPTSEWVAGDPVTVGPATLNTNFPVVGSAGSIALALLGSDYLVQLELSAMQSEGRGEVVSSPRVITSNQTEAVIKQGVEVPYQQASSSGATNVSFKSAVLSLKVTPQITPDDKVIMDLEVSKDSVGEVVLGTPSINTRSITTQVLVNNGDTVVLGGIYEQIRSEGVDKVPLLGDLPLIGVLFRHKYKVDDKAELLIFVTPKILKDSLGSSTSSLLSSR
jgi:type IV pilus assembly protein PilQ